MKEIEAIAFDIDGTLYSDMSLYIRILPYFLKRLPFFLAYNRARKILHRTAPLADFYEYQARLLAEELKISSQDAKKMIQENVYDGMKPFFKKIKAFKGVHVLFEECKKRNIKIGILSDFPPEQKGDIWGLAPMCDVIMGSEECGALKPSIYTFGSFAKALNVLPEKILYVGNSIRADINGAKKAGMKTAYIMPFWRKILNKKLAQADISFKNYRQLKKIVLE
ncbi:MAG: HAD family hydrolase [Spirochaetaceae bacterium]|nr:HAD family hydrolase [Spirochaetaceae bacterium]